MAKVWAELLMSCYQSVMGGNVSPRNNMIVQVAGIGARNKREPEKEERKPKLCKKEQIGQSSSGFGSWSWTVSRHSVRLVYKYVFNFVKVIFGAYKVENDVRRIEEFMIMRRLVRNGFKISDSLRADVSFQIISVLK